MKSKLISPPYGAIECFGKFHGPEVLMLVGHGGDRATFHLAESYLHHLGKRWTALRGMQASELPRGLFGGFFRGVFGGVFRELFNRLPGCKNPRILNLKGDYPDAIRILLQIATHEYTKLPKTLAFAEIVRLAEVAARWDCHKMLATFVEGWIAPYHDKLFRPGYEQWLYVAYEFGYEQEYLDLSRYFALHCSINSQDRLIGRDGYLLEQRWTFPFHTLLHIRQGRQEILYTILKSLYEQWGTLASGSSCLLDGRTDDHGSRSCAGTNLIEYTNFLRWQRLFPMLKTVEPIKYSPYELLQRVRTELPLDIVDLESMGLLPHSTPPHAECRIARKLVPIVQGLLDNAKWPVDVSEVEYIRQNASECQFEAADDKSCADYVGIPVGAGTVSLMHLTDLIGRKDGQDAVAKGLSTRGTSVEKQLGRKDTEGDSANRLSAEYVSKYPQRVMTRRRAHVGHHA